MISRKRRNSPIPISENEASNKRAKLLSNLWASQEEDSHSIGSTKSNERRSTRAVVRANPKQYVVDWQNRQFTREHHKSGSQSKGSTDQAAVGPLKKKNSSKNPKRSNCSVPQSRGEKSASLPALRKASIKAREPSEKQPHRTTRSSSPDVQDLNNPSGDLRNPLALAQVPTLPDLVVLISQHSSFDREQYIHYPSSLSSTNITSSLLQHQISDISESSLLSESFVLGRFARDGVIPDSQSLPGSSSYAPTSSTSTGNKNLTQPEPVNSVVTTASSAVSTGITNSHPVSSYSPIHEPSDPIEDVTDFVLGESQHCPTQSSRSRSLPLNVFTRSPAVNHTEPGQISRSISDPSTITYVSSSIIEVPSSLDPNTQSHAALEVIESIYTCPRTEVPESSDHQSTQSRNLDLINHPADTSPQIESNAAFHSQETHITSTLSVGKSRVSSNHSSPLCLDLSKDRVEDNWQSGQAVINAVHSVSEISSSGGDSIPEKLVVVQASGDNIQSEGLIQRHSTVLEPPTTAKDKGAGSQTTQNTNSTSLSERDPNFHSSRNIHQTEETKDYPSPSIETAGVNSGNVSNHIMSTGGQYLHTLGSKAPFRPPSVSDFEMAETPLTQMDIASKTEQIPTIAAASPGGSFREKLKTMRAASAAAFAANLAARKASIEESQPPRPNIERTPSAILEKSGPSEAPESRFEVQPLEVPVEVPLPMRVSQPDPHTQNQPSKLSLYREVSYLQITTTLNPVHLGDMEFVIPLAMNTRVRDQYISTINYYRQAIENLMKDEIPDQALVEKVREMLRRVNHVTTHMDLDSGDSMSQQQASAENEAGWAENCSAKFQFLRHLFDCVRDLDLHVGVIAQPGRLLDIFETFLKGRYVVYNRPDTLTRSDPRATRGRMEVSLIASGEEGAATLPKAANLVVALDGSFNAQDVQVGILRSHLTNVGQLSPIIHLLVYNSAEHIERCLPTSIEPLDRLRKIVSCMTQTRHEVGLLLQDEPGSLAAAEEVAAFLEAGGLESKWAFPSIRPIEGIEFVESSQDTESNHSDNQLDVDQAAAPAPTTLKRALDTIEGTTAMPKRPRTTPIPAGDVTHISDSATQDSLAAQTVANLRTALQEAHDEITSIRLAFNEREKHLQDSIKVTQGRLEDHIEALSSLQIRYESLTRSSHLLRDSKTTLSSTVVSLEERLERRAADVANLINDRQRLETEVKEARSALIVSSNPGIAELGRLREETRIVTQQREALQKKNESLTKDFDFTRQQYQQASTSAVELASENTALKAQVATLTIRASSTATTLAAINNDTETRRHRSRVLELESLLAACEDHLRRKDDELRDMKRGRAGGVQTRGSSVQPRSPRAGNGSRGGSPVPVVGVGGGVGLLGVEMRRGGSGLRWG